MNYSLRSLLSSQRRNFTCICSRPYHQLVRSLTPCPKKIQVVQCFRRDLPVPNSESRSHFAASPLKDGSTAREQPRLTLRSTAHPCAEERTHLVWDPFFSSSHPFFFLSIFDLIFNLIFTEPPPPVSSRRGRAGPAASGAVGRALLQQRVNLAEWKAGLQRRMRVEFKFRTYLNCRAYTVP